MIVTILPRIRPVLIFDSLEYRMPVAWISFIAFAPRYQAMAPKRLKKMPMMPKIKNQCSLRVLWRSRTILLTVGQRRSAGLKIVRRRKSDLGTVLSVGILYMGVGHGQPLLLSEPRTAASSQKASQADCSVCQKFALEIPAMIASTMNSVARTQIDTPIMPVTSPAMA